MTAIDVKARWNTGAKDAEDKVIYNSVIVPFDFGTDLTEAVEKFGEEAVYDNYLSAARIQFQNAIRTHGEAGVAADEIADKLTNYMVGEKAAKVVADPMAVIKQRYQAAADNPEEQAKIMAEIMGETPEAVNEEEE